LKHRNKSATARELRSFNRLVIKFLPSKGQKFYIFPKKDYNMNYARRIIDHIGISIIQHRFSQIPHKFRVQFRISSAVKRSITKLIENKANLKLKVEC